jgi:hypothetical protein
MKIFNYTIVARLFLLILMLSCCLLACKEEYDHTEDVATPKVVSFYPTPGVEEVSVNSNLVMTFDEIVKKGTGNIIVKTETTSKTFDVNSEAVVIGQDARVVTIKPGEMESDEKYTITIDQGAFTDLLGNKFLGTSGGTPWTYTTAGTAGPMVLSQVPANGSTGASLFKLELTFLGEVKKGTGNIIIYAANNAKVAEMSIASSAIVVQNNKVSVNLGLPLAFGTGYYVNIDNGAILDAAGKKFKGFKGTNEWSFTTTGGSGSELVVHLPMDQDLGDISGNKFDASNGSTATANVEFVTDPIRGKVASFVAGSFAALPKHNLLRPSMTQDFSINIWMKLPPVGSDPALFGNSDWDSGGNPGMILNLDGALTYTGADSPGRGWAMKITGGVRMNWRANEQIPPAPPLADNQWHMVTMVVNQTAKRLQVYIDGVNYTNTTPASYDLTQLTDQWWDAANDYPFTIWEDGTGKYNAGHDTRGQLAGFVDDFRIYNKALTPQEVTALFDN